MSKGKWPVWLPLCTLKVCTSDKCFFFSDIPVMGPWLWGSSFQCVLVCFQVRAKVEYQLGKIEHVRRDTWASASSTSVRAAWRQPHLTWRLRGGLPGSNGLCKGRPQGVSLETCNTYRHCCFVLHLYFSAVVIMRHFDGLVPARGASLDVEMNFKTSWTTASFWGSTLPRCVIGHILIRKLLGDDVSSTEGSKSLTSDLGGPGST